MAHRGHNETDNRDPRKTCTIILIIIILFLVLFSFFSSLFSVLVVVVFIIIFIFLSSLGIFFHTSCL